MVYTTHKKRDILFCNAKPGNQINYYYQAQKPGNQINYYYQAQKPGNQINYYYQAQRFLLCSQPSTPVLQYLLCHSCVFLLLQLQVQYDISSDLGGKKAIEHAGTTKSQTKKHLVRVYTQSQTT